jgi:O-antigen/teichoic acid export membrane protein
MKDSWNEIKGFFTRFKDLTTLGFASVASTAISGIFWLFIASLLGTEHYGEVSYLIAISYVALAICSIGGSNTILVYSAKEVKIQSPIYFITTISSIVAAGILFLIIHNVETSLLVITSSMFSIATAEIIGRKFYLKYSKYILLQRILFVGMAIGIYYVIGPYGIILGLAISYLPFLIPVYKGLLKFDMNFSVLRQRSRFLVNSYFLDLSRTFSGQTDKLFVAPLFGFAILGNYQLGVQFLTLLTTLPGIVYSYVLPHDASGNPNKRLKKTIIIISIILAALGSLLGPIIMSLLFPKFTSAADVIQIISFAVIPTTINYMYISKFLGSENNKIVVMSSGIYVLVQVTGIFMLGHLFGIRGVTSAFVLAASAESLFLFIMDRFSRKDELPNT